MQTRHAAPGYSGNEAAALSLEVRSCNLEGKLSLYAADIDPTFESCQAANVVRSWAWVAKTFEEKHSTSVIQVRKGKRFCYRIPLDLGHEVGGSSS